MPHARIRRLARRSLIRRAASELLVPLLMFGLPGAGWAQGAQYTTVTKISLPGALGAIVSFAAKAGGGGEQYTQTTYVTPTRRRTDDGTQTEIMDLNADRIINIDRAKKQYSIMTFEQAARGMAAAARQLGASMSGPTQQSSQGAPATSGSNSQLNTQVSFDLKPTGRHEKILGHEAAESYLTEALNFQETAQKGSDSTANGNLTVFEDVWVTKDLPGVAKVVQAFDHNMAQKMGSNLTPADVASFTRHAPQMSGNSNYSAAMKKASENASVLAGSLLRSVMYLVTVPDGLTFNPQLALNQGKTAKSKKKSGGFGSFLGAAIASAVTGDQQQNQKKQNQQAKPTPPQQRTIMTSTTVMTHFKVGAIPASMFQLPAGYTQVPPASAQGGG